MNMLITPIVGILVFPMVVTVGLFISFCYLVTIKSKILKKEDIILKNDSTEEIENKAGTYYMAKLEVIRHDINDFIKTKFPGASWEFYTDNFATIPFESTFDIIVFLNGEKQKEKILLQEGHYLCHSDILKEQEIAKEAAENNIPVSQKVNNWFIKNLSWVFQQTENCENEGTTGFLIPVEMLPDTSMQFINCLSEAFIEKGYSYVIPSENGNLGVGIPQD